MGRRIATSPTEFTILLFVMLALVHVAIPVRAQIVLISGWMTQPVILDGQITTAKEWSDAIPMGLAFRNTPGVTIPVRIWIKNDLKWIYILAAVKWPANDTDRNDRFILHIYNGPVKPGAICDESGVRFDGWTIDNYGVDGGDWREDTQMSPPGEINVRGGASHNGTHYLFEFGKPLNTGDRYDLVLVPGQTYTVVRLRFRDNSDPKGPWYDFWPTLRLAPLPPLIDTARPDDGTISGVSQVDFKASISGHLSKATLFIAEKEHNMELNVKTRMHEISLTLADGIYKWRVSALGVLGNATSMSERSLTVDTTKPAVTIRSPTSGEVVRKSEVLVSWEALDATSGIAKVEVKVDASDWVDVTGKTSYVPAWLVEGNHEVRVRVTDKAGNADEKVATFTFQPPPWYVTYWYVLGIPVAAVVGIAAIRSRRRPPRLPVKPPEAKPLKIVPRPPKREELLKELEELYRSRKITESSYRRLKKKYETEAD